MRNASIRRLRIWLAGILLGLLVITLSIWIASRIRPTPDVPATSIGTPDPVALPETRNTPAPEPGVADADETAIQSTRASLDGRMVPLAVHVFDEDTKQGIPWLEVEIWTKGERRKRLASAKTDIHGDCSVDIEANADKRILHLTDADVGFEDVFELEKLMARDGKSAAVGVKIGPTYVLSIEGESGKGADLRAQLVVDVELGRQSSRWLAVHDVPQTWVRFPVGLRGGHGPAGLPASIKVCDSSGLHMGLAATKGTVGVYLDPLRVELRSRAGVEGRVLDMQGSTVSGVRLGLSALDDQPAMPFGLGRGTEMTTGQTGAYRFTALEPGRYTLTAESDSSFPFEHEIEVPPGETLRYDVVLGAGEVGTLRGTIVSSYGWSGHANPRVCIAPLERPDFSRTFEVKMKKPGEPTESKQVDAKRTWTRGSFEIRNVPVKDYRLMIFMRGESGGVRMYFNPESITVRPPDEHIEMEYVMSPAFGGCSFDVSDSLQRLVDPFDLVVFTEVADTLDAHLSGVPIPRTCWNGKPVLTVLERSPLRWMICSAGYQPAFGDEHAIDWSTHKFPFHAAATLQPGWGGLLMAYREDPDGVTRVFPGVSVVADAVKLGVTDGEGLYRLSTTSAPRCLEVTQVGYVSSSLGRGKPFMPTCLPASDQHVFLFVMRPQ